MNVARVRPVLETLWVKYGLPLLKDISEDGNSILVRCAHGGFRFCFDDVPLPTVQGEICVPLLHWRVKRKFIEMKNILLAGNVKEVVGMRIRAVTPKDGFWTLERMLAAKIDLIQWFFHDRISTVFSTPMANKHLNAIFCTQSGIRISAEIGEGPSGSAPSFLHEIIGRTGIISDLPVDTQVDQSSIYLFKDGLRQVYTDVDYELYGITQVETDCIRFIMSFLANQISIDSLKEDWRAVWDVIRAVGESGESKKKVEISFSGEERQYAQN